MGRLTVLLSQIDFVDIFVLYSGDKEGCGLDLGGESINAVKTLWVASQEIPGYKVLSETKAEERAKEDNAGKTFFLQVSFYVKSSDLTEMHARQYILEITQAAQGQEASG